MITRYIICGALLTISVGGLLGLLFVSTFLENAHAVVKWLVGSIIAIIIGSGLLFGIAYENTKDRVLWNNGYCIECNNKYRFANAEHNRMASHTTYYYVCDNCGKVIALKNQHEYK